MNILITGGAGFIGSHLADLCVSRGDSVSIIDDLSTGEMRNIYHLKSSPRFNYVIDSVFNAPVVGELVDCADVVVHLAAAVGVRLIVESPVKTIETNVHGTEVLLRAAAKKKKRVILASTSEVYGKSNALPFQEHAELVIGNTKLGRWSYACSKALDEFLALAYLQEKGLPVTVVRFFNTVGPRQTGRYGMVLPTFVRNALNNEPLQIFGDGKQTRCFGYVGDVVEAVVRLIHTPASIGEVVNIGNTEEVSIENLAKKIIEETASSSEIEFIPYSEAYGAGFEDMQRRVPDITKLETLVGYRPTTNLNEIIRSVVTYYRSSRAND